MKYDYEPLLQDYENYKYPSAFEDFKNGSLELEYNLAHDNLEYPDQYSDFIDEQIENLSVIFLNDYDLIIKKEVYFFGCPFEIYKKTYSDRLNSFIAEFPDAHEIDFCDYELKKNIAYSISQLIRDKIWFSNKKKLEFLNDKVAQFTEHSVKEYHEKKNETNSLKWQGTNLEFTELVKALFEANKLNPELKQTEIFKRLKLFFNIDEFNENDKLKDIRNRTITKTPLLNVLETSLNNWITKKD
jgi:hypothetical protein